MLLTPFLDWPDGLILILASASPRRAELLQVAGVPFEVVPPGDVELSEMQTRGNTDIDPIRYTRRLASAKAEAVANRWPGRLVLGADTVVVLEGEILEKPQDTGHAHQILSKLSGRKHQVVTAITLLGGPAVSRWTGHEQTWVEFVSLTPKVIQRYIATGEPMDKAGAYGIQGFGAMMVRRVEGCYFNVMGLPLARLGAALREVLGLDSFGAGEDYHD